MLRNKLSTTGVIKNTQLAGCAELSESQLKQLQEMLLEILGDVIAFCDQHGYRYTLAGGTALGAVRHQGFIPWDDDIDIDIPRADYNELLPHFQREHGDKYIVQIPGVTPNYSLAGARIRLKEPQLVELTDVDTNVGPYIDLVPMESVPDKKFLQYLHFLIASGSVFLLSCRRFYHLRDRYLSAAAGNNDLTKVFKLKIAIGRMISPISIRTMAKIADQACSIYRNPDSKLVTFPIGKLQYFGELRSRSCYENPRVMPFNGLAAKVPGKVEQIMVELYGDYMSIPPVEKREKHQYYQIGW